MPVRRLLGEGSVGPLDGDGRARSERGERGAVIPRGPDRDPHPLAARDARERVGMGLPTTVRAASPGPGGTAAERAHAIQRPSGEGDRHDSRRLGPRGEDARAMPCGAQQRHDDAVGDDHAQRPHPEDGPGRPRDGMADERRSGGDLVGEGQREPEVGVEVHRPPRLIRHAATRPAVGRHAGGGEQEEADRGRENAGEGGDEQPQLAQRARPRLLRIAPRHERAVGRDEQQRPRGEAAMPPHELGGARPLAPAGPGARRGGPRSAARRPRRGRRGARARSGPPPARSARRAARSLGRGRAWRPGRSPRRRRGAARRGPAGAAATGRATSRGCRERRSRGRPCRDDGRRPWEFAEHHCAPRGPAGGGG